MTAPSIYTLDGGAVNLHLHPGQYEAWNSEAREIAIISGTQGGKTSFGPWWLAREISRRGAGDYIAGTATYDLFKLKLLPELRQVFENVLRIGRWWAGDKIMELCDPDTGEFYGQRSDDPAMWGRVILRAASSPGGLESATALAAWLDEAGQDRFKLDAYEAVERRLALNEGRKLITTTPYNLGWLKQKIFDRRGDPDVHVIQFPSTLNPAFPPAEFSRQRSKMQTWRFRMMYMGLFERPAGLIYDDFIDDYRENGGHLVRPFAIPPEWPRYGGLDPGGAHVAKIYAARDPNLDIYYLYRESLTGGKTTAEHAREVLRWQQLGERYLGWWVGQPAESQQRRDFSYNGLPVVREVPFAGIEEGIDRVTQLLKEHRLYIFDTLEQTRDQFMTYARVLDENDTPTDKIRDKETYHLLDAIRYLAAGLTTQGKYVA